MEAEDFLLRRRRTKAPAPPYLPRMQWRKALNVIRTCYRMSLFAKAAVPRRYRPHTCIEIHDDPGFSVGADDENFKCLVKDRRRNCLSSLGGVNGIADALESSKDSGIRGDGLDLRRRRKAFGENTYPKRKAKSLGSQFGDALRDVSLIVLLVGAGLSLSFGIKKDGVKHGWYGGASILVSVLVIAAVSAVGKHCKTKLFDKHQPSERDNTTVTVVRGAERQDVPTSDIVVGDIVILKIGDVVPADGVFLCGDALQVDDVRVTAGHQRWDIDSYNLFCASGTKVTGGYGRIIVTAVGKDTACGELLSTIVNRTTEPTPLQKRLDGLMSKMVKVRNTFAVLTALYFTGSGSDVSSKVVGIFQNALGIIVGAIPEALPLAVTLTLYFSLKRMAKEHALVRRLAACEMMGSVTAICIEAAGLLTLNQMEVAEFWVDTNRVEAGARIASAIIGLLCQGIGLNDTGSRKEKALLSWAVTALGMDVEILRMSCKVLRAQTFHAIGDNKCRGVLIMDTARCVRLAHWKGNADTILAKCSSYVGADGVTRKLDTNKRRNFNNVFNDMAKANLRSIAFAFKHVHDNDERSKIQDELTLLGFVGLKDPCRPEVKDAIEACAKVGISVTMVTGDKTDKAHPLAVECGIMSTNDDADDSIIVEGDEFRYMSPEQQLAIVDRIRVMASSLPMDSQLLVQTLKQKGHVVAVAGDGINNGPDLREADVGLSMGTSVDVSSSDIVIRNNSFHTVVMAAGWGRCIYNNIESFILFQLTANVAALIINLVSAVSRGKISLTTVQLLWVNLIVDAMGAVALASDTPNQALMERPPISQTAPLINNAMWRNLAAQAVFQVAVLLTLQYRVLYFFGTDESTNHTMIFNAFVLCQVFNEFNAREIEQRNIFAGLLRNRVFLIIVAATLALQVLMVEVLTMLAGTKRLSWAQWGACSLIAVMSWPIGWAVKFIPVPEQPLHKILARWKSFFLSTPS